MASTSPAAIQAQRGAAVFLVWFCLRQIDQNIMAPAALGQPAETS
jgi:hypothetical protein